jgi:signal transduction histidine kinase
MKTGLAAALMAMLVLPTLIMAAGGYYLTRETVCEEAAGTAEAVLRWETVQRGRHFAELERTLGGLAAAPELVSLLAGRGNTPDDTALGGLRLLLTSFEQQSEGSLGDFAVYTPDGGLLYHTGNVPIQHRDSLELDRLNEGKSVMVGRHADDGPVFRLMVPVVDTVGSLLGILSPQINHAKLTQIMADCSDRNTQRISMVDLRRETVIPLDENRRRQARWTGLSIGLDAALAGQTGVRRYRDLAGREVIGAYAYLPALDWAILVEQDVAGDVAGLRGLRWKTIGLFGGLTAVCIIFALFMSRQIVRRLEHRDRQTAQQSEQLIAADKLATVGTMAASVAHEINNPLTTINVLIHNLFEESPPQEPQRMDLQIALDEITKIKNIILRFLEFARPQEPEFSEVQVNDVVHRFCQLIRHQTAAKEIKIVEHLDERVPTVTADPSQIDQAILNILFNAIEATPVKGTIELSTTYTAERTVLVRVFNTGPALDPELHEKIFEPFFSTKAQGTGLGLSIVKMIMERHGGRVSAAPVAGRGTEFVLTLYTDKRKVEHGQSAGR